MALDHTADRGVAFCGLKNLSYSVAMYFSLRDNRTSLMRENIRRNTWLLTMKPWASVFQMPANKLVSHRRRSVNNLI